MDRRALSGISPFLLVPLLLCLIQSQLSPSFYPWISALPQFEKCLVAPFVAFGWQYLTSNLVTYTILVKRAVILERRVEDLEKWQAAIDPPQNRQRRRDSDVIRMRDQGA